MTAEPSYRALLGLAPARRISVALIGACLSFGMVSLAILLTVREATGSSPQGGYAAACFGLAAGVSAPFRGRLVDRRGMRRILPLQASGYAAALVALDVVAVADGPSWALLLLAALTGLSAPPLFASARSVWPHAVPPTLVRRGYAITSLIHDAGQVVGPALAGLLFVLADWTPQLVCAAGVVLAAVLLVTGPDAAAAHARPVPMPKLFASLTLLGLLVVSILLGAALGLVQVGVPTIAADWGDDWLGGALLAAFALGSVIGALWFGSRTWHRSVLYRFLVSVLVCGLLLAPVGLATSAAGMAPLLLVAGLAFGPATVSIFESLDVLAPGGGAEALTWVTTAELAGWAAGGALAGLLVVHVGAWAPFVLASVILVVPVGLGLALRRRVRRRLTKVRD
jgi:MFS family permease